MQICQIGPLTMSGIFLWVPGLSVTLFYKDNFDCLLLILGPQPV